MQLIFLALARDELTEAKRFYNRQQQGLGESFQREAQTAARLIQERPLAWQIEVEPVRRFLFDRFPYKSCTSELNPPFASLIEPSCVSLDDPPNKALG